MYDKESEIAEGIRLLLRNDEDRPEPATRSVTCKNIHLGRTGFLAALGLSLVLLTGIVWGFTARITLSNMTCYEERFSLKSLWNVVRYQPVQFHLEPDIPSAFRGHPRPELDEAWANCLLGHLILLNENEMESLGHATEGAATQGSNYIAIIEVFHQIHCVDMIRKYIFREHYPNWNSLKGDPDTVLTHVDHCIDLLRQKILCDADIGMMAYSFDPATQFATARTSNMHMCRDIEAIKDWASERRWEPSDM